MFKAGQAVEVVNAGRAYSTYNDLARAMRLAKWQTGSVPQNGNFYTVLGSSPHLFDSGTIVTAITDGERDYLINEQGLRHADVGKKLAELRSEVEDVRNRIQELREQESSLVANILKLEAM